mgnify:CR=1 FL=1
MRSAKQQGWISAALSLGIAWTAGSCLAASTAADYLRDIKPVLQERCYACHGSLKQQAGLRLDTAERLLAGGKSGPSAVPGQPEKGSLLRRLTTDDEHERMPLEAAPLKPEQIAAIRAWIAAGAPVPPDEREEDDPLLHWSFQRIERPETPPTPETETGNAIDAFLARQHAEHGLSPQPEAERPLLLRRLYLNLVGLPPTLEQLADPRDYGTIVDELLLSPHHGERWGRHWMDVWRYSDWYGLGAQLRNSQKHLWHWRDWIVESLNADKGYDRMILEMLAGDELAPEDPATLRATGFLARNYYLFNRTTWLDDTIEHTGKAFLGLTFNCAKCHDHKYDPIEMVDYYAFRAIFEPHQVRLDPVPGVLDFEKNGLPRVFDDHLDAPTYVHLRGDPAQPDKSAVIAPAVPAVLASFAPPIEAVALPMEAWAPTTREHVLKDHRTEARRQVETAERELAEAQHARDTGAAVEKAGGESSEALEKAVHIALAKLDLAKAEQVKLEAVIAADTAALTAVDEALAKTASRLEGEAMKAKAALDTLMQEGKDEKKLKEAQNALAKAEEKIAAVDAVYTPLRAAKKALETPEHTDDSYAATFPKHSTGRRLMLAQWMVSRDNPLTARVVVNHVWMRHFGEPLVETVFDFGRQAPRPEHHELLDWLAAEFMESGWSFRHLHRLMVTSDAYRRRSTQADADPATLAADPANRHYWRAHSRRMESQALRDSLLQLAGALDPALGGPSLDAKTASSRRSLYFKQSRDDRDQFLSMFDDADILQCYRRDESIVPQQALALSNSAISLDMAEKIAERLHAGHPGADRGVFVETAFQQILTRPSDAAEREACLDFWEAAAALEAVRQAPDPEAAIRSRFVHALLNHNDFVTVR